MKALFVLQDKYILFIPKRNTADAQIKHAVRYFIFLTQRSADMMSLLYDYFTFVRIQPF